MQARLRSAYDGAAWDSGPSVVYDRLAAAALSSAGVALNGALIVDLGAGTGAVSRAVVAGGGRAVAVDISSGMVSRARSSARVLVCDIARLPLRDGVADAACAAFVLSHVPDAVTVLREAARVVRPGGMVVAASFVAGDDHPTKALVDAVAEDFGWREPGWHRELKEHGEPRASDPHAVCAMATEAGLTDVTTYAVHVDAGVLTASQLVAWRLGMAQLAPFVASLPAHDRTRLMDEAVTRVEAMADQTLSAALLVLSSRVSATRATASA